MTTLPQTAPMRMPRPAGAGASHLTIPGPAVGGVPGPVLGGPPAGGAAAGTGAQLTSADVWRIIRSNWWLIGLFVLLFGVAGFFVNKYLAANYSRYTAVGYVRVELEQEMGTDADPRAVDPRALELEQRTQERMLTHPALLLAALENPNSEIRKKTEWFQNYVYTTADGQTEVDTEAAKEYLVDYLTVSSLPSSRLIQISMTYKVPEDCRIIIQEIVNTHIKQQIQDVERRWTEHVRDLRATRDRYEQEHETKVAEMETLSAKLGTDGLGGTGGSGVLNFQLGQLTTTRFELVGEYMSARTKYESLQKTINAGVVPPEVEEYVQRDGTYSQYRYIVNELGVALSTMEGGPENRKRIDLQKKKEAYEGLLEERRAELEQRAVAALLSEAEGEMKAAEQTVAMINQEMEAIRGQIAQVNAWVNEYALLKASEEHLRERWNILEEDVREIEQQRLGGDWAPISWATYPARPETPSFPKLQMTLGLSLVLGLALSLGIAFLREITDTTVRSPRDIARVGQMNLLGMIPHEADDPQAAGARLPLVIFDAPHSMAAEEFRKVRTRLAYSASLDSTRSILVTGSSPGDGKTTVACNLAAGLALNGRRILLVDGNFRRPELHNVFGLTNEAGFSDVLNSMEYFEELVRETQVPNLSVLPAGPKPANGTELLESQLLTDFIERALEEYDHVVFDSGALLVVSETLALAPRVDGVVSVVRARANSRGMLQRMRDTLRQVKAEHLGVVLNAVRTQGGGYYGSNIKTYYAYQNA